MQESIGTQGNNTAGTSGDPFGNTTNTPADVTWIDANGTVWVNGRQVEQCCPNCCPRRCPCCGRPWPVPQVPWYYPPVWYPVQPQLPFTVTYGVQNTPAYQGMVLC